MRHVLFRSGGRLWALPLLSIREVVLAPATWVAVPRAPACALGVFNLRGRVVLGVSLTLLLNESKNRLAETRVLVLDKGRRAVGLSVESVEGIESMECWKEMPPGAHVAHKGVSTLQQGHAILLDEDVVERLLHQAFLG